MHTNTRRLNEIDPVGRAKGAEATEDLLQIPPMCEEKLWTNRRCTVVRKLRECISCPQSTRPSRKSGLRNPWIR